MNKPLTANMVRLLVSMHAGTPSGLQSNHWSSAFNGLRARGFADYTPNDERGFCRPVLTEAGQALAKETLNAGQPTAV